MRILVTCTRLAADAPSLIHTPEGEFTIFHFRLCERMFFSRHHGYYISLSKFKGLAPFATPTEPRILKRTESSRRTELCLTIKSYHNWSNYFTCCFFYWSVYNKYTDIHIHGICTTQRTAHTSQVVCQRPPTTDTLPKIVFTASNDFLMERRNRKILAIFDQTRLAQMCCHLYR